MDLSNALIGIALVVMAIIMIFVGNFYSKKIGILYVLIYFMASFVIFAGVLLLLLYDKPSLF